MRTADDMGVDETELLVRFSFSELVKSEKSDE